MATLGLIIAVVCIGIPCVHLLSQIATTLDALLVEVRSWELQDGKED